MENVDTGETHRQNGVCLVRGKFLEHAFHRLSTCLVPEPFKNSGCREICGIARSACMDKQWLTRLHVPRSEHGPIYVCHGEANRDSM